MLEDIKNLNLLGMLLDIIPNIAKYNRLYIVTYPEREEWTET